LVTRLEAVDAQHPDTVALVSGPLVLMALRNSAQQGGPKQPKEQPNEQPKEQPEEHSAQQSTRAVLLTARQTSAHSHVWTAGSGASMLHLKPFPDIQDETYTTYLEVTRT
jgi:uncharacterized protein